MIILTTEQAQQIEEVISGMLHGTDWNNGTHAKIYRPKFPEALATIRAARTQEFTAEQQDRFATAFDEAFAKAGLPQKQAEQDPVHEALQIASVALQDIACSSQIDSLLWWQTRAREAQKQIAECLTNAAPAEPVKQEPVAQQDSDDKRLLREIFMLCEATEELEPTNDFMRGRIFEAKGIRRSIGTWYQDTFCGRSYMGEPVLNAAHVQQAEQEPVGRWNWNEAKFEWLTKFDYYKHHMTPLYAAPVRTKDLTDAEAEFAFERGGNELCLKLRAVIAKFKEKNR